MSMRYAVVSVFAAHSARSLVPRYGEHHYQGKYHVCVLIKTHETKKLLFSAELPSRKLNADGPPATPYLLCTFSSGGGMLNKGVHGMQGSWSEGK